MALNRGTWAIESGTKLNWHLWDGLDIELVPKFEIQGCGKLTVFKGSCLLSHN